MDDIEWEGDLGKIQKNLLRQNICDAIKQNESEVEHFCFLAFAIRALYELLIW